MSRTDDLDRLYGHLVFLCDEARFLNHGQQYALMLAFNTISELHTPSRILVDDNLDLNDAIEQAASLAGSLCESADGIDQIIRLRAADSLLRSVLESWAAPRRDVWQ